MYTREYPLAEGRVIELWVTYRLSDVTGWDDTCGVGVQQGVTLDSTGGKGGK